MRLGQLNRLKKLEKQLADDALYQSDRFIAAIYEECPKADEVRKVLNEYVIRYGPQPPRFYQYDEDEGIRRIMWALRVDSRAQALCRNLAKLIELEVERRAVEREQKAADELLNEWLEFYRSQEP